ncbi:MAG: hypothetical protein RML33_10085 [Acidobacteriota bacterium]|nr:hypothetical protein [Pyrinomonadaceae bacterium]MDW8305167.1 hypothetical protein [Acidobacteriota bacterium]
MAVYYFEVGLHEIVIFLMIFNLFALVVLGILTYKWQHEKAEFMLEKWAKMNKYEILMKSYANPIGTGPGVGSRNPQIMYRVVVKDSKGERRSGVIKVGSRWLGVFEEKITVDWDGDQENAFYRKSN